MSAEMSDREKQEARAMVWIFCTIHRRGMKVSITDWQRLPGHGCPECQKAKEARR